MVSTLEQYEEILDALDGQNETNIISLFTKYELKPNSKLFDAPRLDENNNELETYLDYVIAHSLTVVIDCFIDEIGLHYNTDDEILSRCIQLDNIEIYNYFVQMGYNPDDATFKILVQKSCSQQIANILSERPEFIECIVFDDIQEMFLHDLDEETVETVQALINAGIDTSLFTPFIDNLKTVISRGSNNNNDDNDFKEDEKDIVIELIDLFETLDIPME